MGLQTGQLGDPFAVVTGGTEERLGAAGAFEVQMRGVFPGESDAAMDLNALGGDVIEGVRAVCLGDGGSQREIIGAGFGSSPGSLRECKS